MKTPRNRIKRHVTIRAGDLVPHELNARVHGSAQRAALARQLKEFSRRSTQHVIADYRRRLIQCQMLLDVLRAPRHC